jgi:hypothetical protein
MYLYKCLHSYIHIYLCVCLHICLYLSVHMFISVSLSVHFCISIYSFLYPYLLISVSLYVHFCLSIHLFVCLSISLSLSPLVYFYICSLVSLFSFAYLSIPSALFTKHVCVWGGHRYVKNNRLLKFYCVAATSGTSSKAFSTFFAAAINSTNEANKTGGTRH